jgi:hypothetical protein
VDARGQATLHLAASKGHLTSVRLLLAHNARGPRPARRLQPLPRASRWILLPKRQTVPRCARPLTKLLAPR